MRQRSVAYLGPSAAEPPNGALPTVVDAGQTGRVIVGTSGGSSPEDFVLFVKYVGGGFTAIPVLSLPLGADHVPSARLAGDLCPAPVDS